MNITHIGAVVLAPFPWVLVKVKTDEEGHISVRGFHGGYSVTVLHEGRQIKGSFRLERGKPCRVRVTMDSGNG